MSLSLNRQAIGFFVATLAIAGVRASFAADPPARPNVIFILVDDKYYNAMPDQRRLLESSNIAW